MTALHGRHVNPVLFANVDGKNWRLSHYQERGGYQTFKRLLKENVSRETILEELEKSHLRGRGGAAFPVATKWKFFPNQADYLVCNADESEPGTFKDRDILRFNPHALLEGILIAAYTLKIPTGYIYIHGEIWDEYVRFEEVILEAKKANLLGQHILGSSFHFDLHAVHGFGAYVCGEETGLLESLEGKRGQPRFKPPYPATHGLYGKPTLINNVETLAYIPFILEKGGETFANLGQNNAKGMKIFSISGDVVSPGNYEVPLGTPFKTLLELAKGVKGGQLKAIIPGGASSPVLPAHIALDLTMDYEPMMKAGSMLGSGGIIVLNDTRNMVHVLHNLADFFFDESCGQCTPCREGTTWMFRILDRIKNKTAQKEDIELLETIANNMKGKTLCALGDAATMPVLSFLKHFRDEFL